jgi:integrase
LLLRGGVRLACLQGRELSVHASGVVSDHSLQPRSCAIGSKPRLAIALFRYLGVRRSDVVRIGKQHVRAGVLRLTTKKCPTTLEFPLPQALQRIIELSPTGDLTFLTTDYGKPFTEAGFGGWFRAQCDAAGLPQCSAHGLRKAAAIELAEAGASAHQLMSWFGWKSLRKPSATPAPPIKRSWRRVLWR